MWRPRGLVDAAAALSLLMLLAPLATMAAGCGGDDAGTPSPRPSRSPTRTAPSGGGTVPLPNAYDVLGIPTAPTVVPAGARTDYAVPPFARLVARFAYDRDAPLAFQVHGETRSGRAAVLDVSYRGAGHTVRAWLVMPVGSRPLPAVLFAPSYAGDRDEFLGEAENMLAPGGCAALLIDTPQNLWSFDADQDARSWVSLLTDLRRGLDLLATLPQIDTQRLGFVGLRQGADAGAILSGVDARIKAYCLISCATYLNQASWFDGPGAESPTGPALRRFLSRMFAFSPVLYVGHGRPAAFLFMASRLDPEYPVPYVKDLYAAAPQPKRLRWHDAGRYLDAASYRFQSEWLLRHL